MENKAAELYKTILAVAKMYVEDGGGSRVADILAIKKCVDDKTLAQSKLVTELLALCKSNFSVPVFITQFMNKLAGEFGEGFQKAHTDMLESMTAASMVRPPSGVTDAEWHNNPMRMSTISKEHKDVLYGNPWVTVCYIIAQHANFEVQQGRK